MKTQLLLTILTSLTIQVNAAEPVSEDRTWAETYSVSGNTPRLFIRNIWGNVRVRAGAPGQISISIDEHRSAPDQAAFELSRETIKTDVLIESDGVSIVVAGSEDKWQHLDRCRGCRVDYQFDVLVPPGTSVDVSTVTDGRVDVAGISGPVSASNVNGPIAITALHDCGIVESVNGSVELSFAHAPGRDCTIETINGDITMGLPAGAGLIAALDLFNGRMVSEIDGDPLALPARIEEVRNDGRYQYRIEQPAGVRLGGGGPTFSFTSLNGDIRINAN